jgi:hypothetical protein
MFWCVHFKHPISIPQLASLIFLAVLVCENYYKLSSPRHKEFNFSRARIRFFATPAGDVLLEEKGGAHMF